MSYYKTPLTLSMVVDECDCQVEKNLTVDGSPH